MLQKYNSCDSKESKPQTFDKNLDKFILFLFHLLRNNNKKKHWAFLFMEQSGNMGKQEKEVNFPIFPEFFHMT